MTSKYFFLNLVVLVVNTGAKNYLEIFSRTGGKSTMTSQIFNHTEGSCSSFKEMNLPSEHSVYCHFMEMAEFFDRTKLWRSHLT